MAGSFNLFDAVRLTNQDSESDPRNRAVDTLQIHHGTILSINGLIDLMMPGSRTVSANGAMANDGTLYEVVLAGRRAYTSATSYDHQCITVEVCNVSLGPSWGISEACRIRLAKLAVAMFKAGLLGSLTRRHIIGHNEVPGTYATACPGPDMLLDHIVALANKFFTEGETPTPTIGNLDMFLGQHPTGAVTYFGEFTHDGVTAGEFAYLLPACGGVYVKMTDEGYRQELINVDIRAREFRNGISLSEAERAAIAASTTAGVADWIAKHSDRSNNVADFAAKLEAEGFATGVALPQAA